MLYEGYDVPKNFIGGMNHMRTLKKVLALSLVFAMAFTMMAGAAFKDESKIDSALTNDIQLLTALGVFKGDENGNFNPTDNVRRSEAAKMIYVLKNNGVDDGAVAFQGVSKYSDVPVGHWAEGYINYCTNLGYMSGWQENGVQKFDPNGNVTGVELMKMLLCMIGYKADVQGYTGNGWQTNVLVDAATSGLSVEFTPSVYGATPRQWTARLMTNALDAYYVTYNKGELTYADTTYAAYALKLNTVEGYLRDAGKVELSSNGSGTYSVTLDKDGEYISVDPNMNLATAAGANGPVSFKTTVDASLLGQYVKVYYRAGTTTDTHKVYAVLATGKSDVYETTLGNVTVGKNTTDDYESIKFEGYNGGVAKKYADGDVIQLVKNLSEVTKLTAASDSPVFGALGNNSNAAIRFVDQDGNGTIDLAFTDATVYAKVDTYNADKYTLKFVDGNGTAVTGFGLASVTGITGAIDSEDEFKLVNVNGTIAKDDVVAITVDATSGKQIVNVSKVEGVSSSVTGYTLDSGNYATITINGTETKFAANKMGNYNITTGGTVLKDTTFYTDGKFVVYSTGGTASASVENLAYITAVDVSTAWGSNTYKVKALLADGTVGEYEVAAAYDEADVKVAVKDTVATGTGTSVNGSNLTQANRYSDATKVTAAMNGLKEDVLSYSISDGKITLRTLKNDSNITFKNGTLEYNNSKKIVNDTDATAEYAIDANAYFFVKSTVSGKTSYSVVKASELAKNQTSQSAGAYAVKSVNNISTLLFGVLNLNTSVVASDATYAFVNTDASYKLVNGKHTVEMGVILPDGTTTTIKNDTYADAASANTAIGNWKNLRGKVVTYTVDSNGNVTADPTKVVAADQYAYSSQVDNDGALTAEKWNKLSIVGWNGNVVSAVVNGNKGDDNSAYVSTLVAVASNVKIHYVDCTSKTYAVSDDAAKVEPSTSTAVQSAYAYVQTINGIDTITDIFVEVDGASAALLWN